MKKRTKIFVAIGIILIGAVSYLAYQQKFFIKMAMVPLRPYSPTELPIDTTNLFITKGNLENNAAFIYVQGGPNYVLFTETFNPLLMMPNSENL